MSMLLSWPFVVGCIAAAAYICLLRLLDSYRSRQLYGAGLLTAALIYVGFAELNHGASHLRLELSGLLIFSVVSWVGVRRWPLILGLGWLAHGGWDFWHSAHPDGYVPSWWPAFCVGIDWVVGAYIVIQTRRKSLTTAPAKHP